MGGAYYAVKVLVSAVLIVAVAELSKRSTLWGGLLASLPLISVLAMIWLYIDTRDTARIAAFAGNVFWLVLPSLLLFLLLPLLLKKGLNFYGSLTVSIAAAAVAYRLLFLLLQRFGVTS